MVSLTSSFRRGLTALTLATVAGCATIEPAREAAELPQDRYNPELDMAIAERLATPSPHHPNDAAPTGLQLARMQNLINDVSQEEIEAREGWNTTEISCSILRAVGHEAPKIALLATTELNFMNAHWGFNLSRRAEQLKSYFGCASKPTENERTDVDEDAYVIPIASAQKLNPSVV